MAGLQGHLKYQGQCIAKFWRIVSVQAIALQNPLRFRLACLLQLEEKIEEILS